MNVYKIISRCRFSVTEGCHDFSLEVETFDSVEEAKEYYPEFDETASQVIEEYDIEKYYIFGTANQIQSTYDSGKWFELCGDEDEIEAHEKEFTYAVDNLE